MLGLGVGYMLGAWPHGGVDHYTKEVAAMATTSTAAHARIVATFRQEKGSVSSALALLDDARSIGKDSLFSITKEDRLDDVKGLKGEEGKKARARAEKIAGDWSRQVWTAVQVFDLVVDKRAAAATRKEAATAILKRARRGSTSVKAAGCTIEGSGDKLVNAVQAAIEGKKDKKAAKADALTDMGKVVSDSRQKDDSADGPLLKAAKAKVEAMERANVEGEAGNKEKAAKIAAQIAEAAAYLATRHQRALDVLARVEADAAKAAAQADMEEVEAAA